MNSFPKPTILFIDDDQCMREVMALMLNEEGYDVSTAVDGFDALAQLRLSIPDLIITDLTMPRMSGIEFLSVVRRRFPSIPTIAISGAHAIDARFPVDVMADAFYPKGRCHPDELMRTIQVLIGGPLPRPSNYRPCQPPAIQAIRRSHDSAGLPVLLLTCIDCLRTFSLNSAGRLGDDVLETHCTHCHAPVHFFIDIPQARVPAMMPSGERVSRSVA